MNPDVKKLSDSAAIIASHMGDSNYQKAILLLDKAIAIDSNYFIVYWNKLIFQSQLKQYGQAIGTAKNLIRLRPMAPDLYLTCGELYERTDDTLSAKDAFQKALSLYNNLLDTMSVGNSYYDMLFMDKAIDLVMLGDQIKGNEMLKQLYDRQTDESYKELISSFMNKSGAELLATIDRQQPATYQVR